MRLNVDEPIVSKRILPVVKRIPKIVSGGQTGSGPAALDWALVRGVECGGWCPKVGRPRTGRLIRSIRSKKRLQLRTFSEPNRTCVIVTLRFYFRLNRI